MNVIEKACDLFPDRKTVIVKPQSTLIEDELLNLRPLFSAAANLVSSPSQDITINTIDNLYRAIAEH